MSDTPILDALSSPADVRALAEDRLPALAAEVRRVITRTVAERGGHLASNLGAVELTIALHRAFNFERDRLVLDVGHQCYAHKLLTGRAEALSRLRTRAGASGFPSPEESPFDLFVTGHASTAVSMALGLACADRGTGRRSVAVVGDGAIAGGLAFEGLNHAGHVGADLLVVLNDNEMSIGRTVGALARHLSRIRLDPHYNDLRSELRRLGTMFPLFGGVGRRVADVARRAFTGGSLFQDLGFRYIGPVDGHDLEGLESTLRSARELSGPVLLHDGAQTLRDRPDRRLRGGRLELTRVRASQRAQESVGTVELGRDVASPRAGVAVGGGVVLVSEDPLDAAMLDLEEDPARHHAGAAHAAHPHSPIPLRHPSSLRRVRLASPAHPPAYFKETLACGPGSARAGRRWLPALPRLP